MNHGPLRHQVLGWKSPGDCRCFTVTSLRPNGRLLQWALQESLTSFCSINRPLANHQMYPILVDALKEIRQTHQFWGEGSWNPIIYKGFSSIQTVIGLGISWGIAYEVGNGLRRACGYWYEAWWCQPGKPGKHLFLPETNSKNLWK